MDGMIRILAVAALLVSGAALASDAFCRGFQVGYGRGYCAAQGVAFNMCLKPLPPLCPLPGLGQSTFQDGYDAGFSAGMASGG